MSGEKNINSINYAKKVLIAAGIVVPIILIIWFLGAIFELLLLILAATLVHAIFMSFAEFIHHYTKIPTKWAKGVSVIVVLGMIFLMFWFLAPQVSAQVKQLMSQLPNSFQAAKNDLRQYWWGSFLLSQIPNNFSKFLETHSYFMDFFSTTFGAIVNIYIILLLAAYFLVNPRPYARGLVKLFPQKKRTRIQQVIYKVYRTLQLWMEGKLLSMLFVAVLTIIGLYILGFPLALVLGLIAGFLGFIPNFGPIIAAIPAVLIAFTQGPNAALYIIILYTGVQWVQNIFFEPLVERYLIDLPIAMILLAQVALGFLTGILGVILATPLVAAVIAAVKMLYVHDVLGDEEAEVDR